MSITLRSGAGIQGALELATTAGLAVLVLLCSSPSRVLAEEKDSSGVESTVADSAAMGQFDDAKASGGGKGEEDDRGLVLLPVVVSDPLLGVGFGAAGMYSFAMSDHPDARGSFVSASALITTNKQLKLALTHNLDVPESHFVFRGRILLKLFSEDYWGVGNDTPESNARHLEYDSIDYLGRFNVATKYEHWFVGPLIRFNITWNSDLEEPYPPPELAGDELKSFLMLGLGLSVVYDSRDSLTNPYEGFYFALELINLPSGFPRAPDTTVGVISGVADVRGYWQPFQGWDQILAMRAYADLNFGRVPFAMLSTPGRDDTWRVACATTTWWVPTSNTASVGGAHWAAPSSRGWERCSARQATR
jgi:hypothetical protein